MRWLFVINGRRTFPRFTDVRGKCLYRFDIFSYGNFTQDAERQLAVTKLKSFVLDGPVNCVFRCIGEPQCLSFNLAAHPDSNGFYQCDLLASDKYRAAAKDFQANGAFHHYSPWVNIRTLFFSFFFPV